MKKFIFCVLSVLFLSACAQIISENADENSDLDKMSVEELESFIEEEIRNAKSCEIDDDCVNMGNNCPFGCGITINEKNKSHILDLFGYNDLRAEEEGIFYSCEPCPMPGRVECVNGYCTTLNE